MDGQTWANVGQTFGIIGFLNFEFGGANFTLFKKQNCVFRLNKRWGEKFKSKQTWANVGQAFGIIDFLNFEFGGAIFMLFKKKIVFLGSIKGGQKNCKSG